MSDPNETQVGGDHYSKAYQVWDFAEANGLGGLEMCIIKYVCRWRVRDGLADLQKAEHYIDKLMDLHINRRRVPKGHAPLADIATFSTSQGLSPTEDTAVMFISSWSDLNDLLNCRAAIQRLMTKVEADVSTS